MIDKLKKFTLQVIGGANVAAIILMLLVGYSGHLNPVDHPALANLGLTYPALILLNLAFLVLWACIKLRYVFIPIAGFLLAYVPTRAYFPVNLPQDPPQKSIKILSYNVESFIGEPGNKDQPVNPIAEYLLKSKADIICLQEAGGHEHFADTLLRREYPFVSSYTKAADVLAVYSKFPIQRTEPIEYPSVGNLSMAYELDIDGQRVLLVNNHFETNALEASDKSEFNSLIRGDVEGDSAKITSTKLLDKLAAASKKRAPQIDAVVRYISSHRGGKAVIVCGDFNESPISYSHYRFADILNDCYIASANGPGFSYNRSHIYVRIDNIFCSDHFKPYAAKVDKKIAASDHYPIYCWLKRR